MKLIVGLLIACVVAWVIAWFCLGLHIGKTYSPEPVVTLDEDTIMATRDTTIAVRWDDDRSVFMKKQPYAVWRDTVILEGKTFVLTDKRPVFDPVSEYRVRWYRVVK